MLGSIFFPETTAVSDLRAGDKREGKVTLLK